MKAFVINLKKSKDRRDYIKNHFGKYDIDFEFFDAVDGRILPQDYIDGVYDQEIAKKTWKDMNRGEIGCSLSHMGIYEKMINENITEAIIFEDDVILNDDFNEFLKSKDKWLKPNMELILLGYQNTDYFKIPWQKLFLTGSKDYKIGKFYGYGSGTHAYYINLSGAKKMLSKNKPKIIRAIDDITGDAIYGGHNLYAIFPPIADYKGDTSDIGYHDSQNIFNGLYISPPTRFFAINLNWAEKFAVFVDKILRIILLYPLWRGLFRKTRKK